jgi:hypothetical protein
MSIATEQSAHASTARSSVPFTPQNDPFVAVPSYVMEATMQTLTRTRHSLICLSELFRQGSLGNSEMCFPGLLEYLITDLEEADSLLTVSTSTSAVEVDVDVDVAVDDTTTLRFPANVIYPHAEVDHLLAAWRAYDAVLKNAPKISRSTQRRRDLAADALYEVMFMACTGDTLADFPMDLTA